MISIDKRFVEYEKFYVEKGIDITTLLKEYETEKDANDGYQCVCCYCLNNTPVCLKSCCKDGKPCNDYKDNIISINNDRVKI